MIVIDIIDTIGTYCHLSNNAYPAQLLLLDSLFRLIPYSWEVYEHPKFEL